MHKHIHIVKRFLYDPYDVSTIHLCDQTKTTPVKRKDTKRYTLLLYSAIMIKVALH